MDSIFSFSRFVKLFLLDISKSKIIYLGIFIAIFTLNFLFLIAFANYNFEKGLFLSLSGIIGFAAPFILYKDINHKTKGIYSVMRPVSVSEKFLSYMLNCIIIIPLLCIIAYVLCVLFFNVFIAEYTMPEFTFISYINFISFQAIGLLGNVFFRNLKFLKTIGFVTICMFSLMIFIATFTIYYFDTFSAALSAEEFSTGTFMQDYLQSTRAKIIRFIFAIVQPYGIWVAIFFKIKEQEY